MSNNLDQLRQLEVSVMAGIPPPEYKLPPRLETLVVYSDRITLDRARRGGIVECM